MAKNIKEVDEISTTDKLKALKTLKEAGLRVEFNGSGVPTVVCMHPDDIEKELKNVRKILKDIRYIGSFGVRGPRKTDSMAGDEERNATAEIAEEVMNTEETEQAEVLTA